MKFWSENLKETATLEPDVDMRSNTEMDLRERGWNGAGWIFIFLLSVNGLKEHFISINTINDCHIFLLHNLVD
jgi:hypothetical protein